MDKGPYRAPCLVLGVLALVLTASSLVFGKGADAKPEAPSSETTAINTPPEAPESQSASQTASHAVPHAPELDAASFVGQDACIGCHEEKAKDWEKNPHHKIEGIANKALANGCESCHGPGSAHVEAGGGQTGIVNPKTAPNHTVINLCLKCHEKDKLIEARSSLHMNEELSCVSCHQIHSNENHKLLAKTETELCKSCHARQVMETNLFARHPIRDGQMACTSCHNPHNAKDKMLVKETVNQLCQKCHPNQVGPFTYDHPPVVESCLTCHKAHGSQNRGMLETRVPLLCLRCHGNTPATHNQSIGARQRCLDCHTSIHGSRRDKWFFNNQEK